MNRSPQVDVAVVGGGPAGLSACLELAKSSRIRTALFEHGDRLGGIPAVCPGVFGFLDRRRLYTGKSYAERLRRLVERTNVAIHTGATITKIAVGEAGNSHRMDLITNQGPFSCESRFILLATGCFEGSRASRIIGGSRPGGIITTGTLQQMVYQHRRKPGERAVIIGSENIAFSAVSTLRRAGIRIEAIIEEDLEFKTYKAGFTGLRRIFRIPVYRGVVIREIFGKERVEGISVERDKDSAPAVIPCDTVIITGRFQPYSGLLDATPVEIDPMSQGPVVNTDLMTSVPRIFAAGNLLRGADMHGFCALEGKRAGERILGSLDNEKNFKDDLFRLKAESPVRYVVPQKVFPNRLKRDPLYRIRPGCSIQTERTLYKPTVEAWAGSRRIWKRRYHRLIGCRRIALPLHQFNWRKVGDDEYITIRIAQ